MDDQRRGARSGSGASLEPDLTVLVIAGGRGRRLGGVELGAKSAVKVGAESLLSRTLSSIAADADVVVVGPNMTGVERDVTWAQEQPPGSGPLAAIGAGLDLATADLVAVLAGDVPRGGQAITQLSALLRASDSADAAVVVQTDGRANPLLAVWRRAALRDALDRCRPLADQPVARLYDGVTVVELADTDNLGADLDTPEDVTDYLAADRAYRSRADGGTSPKAVRPRQP